MPHPRDHHPSGLIDRPWLLRMARTGAFTAGLALLLMAAPISARAQDSDSYRLVEGLSIYLGVIPAAILNGPEAGMHGGIPRGRHQYHLVIAIFDAETGSRVENARVKATVSGLGHIGETSIEMAPMSIAGTVTYGNFVDLPGRDRYEIVVEVRVPSRAASVRAVFNYQHP